MGRKRKSETNNYLNCGNEAASSASRELAEAIAELSSPEDVESALAVFLTKAEMRDLTLRWQILKMLEQGITQRDISKAFGVSLCKITRGSRFRKSSPAIVKHMLEPFLENNNGH